MPEQAVLKHRETVSVLILIAFLCAMSLHALRVTAKDYPLQTQIKSTAIHEVMVTIEGAVEVPGRYHFTKGTKVREILSKVNLLPEADTSRINFDQVVQKSRKIKVPFKKTKSRKKAHTNV